MTALATDFMGVTVPEFVLWIVAAAAIAGAVHQIWAKVVKPIIRGFGAIHDTYEKVAGYDTRLTAVEENTKQLTRNSGSHLADAIYRIESKSEASQRELSAFITWSRSKHEEAQREIAEVWKYLAARDVVKSAEKTAEIMDKGESDS